MRLSSILPMLGTFIAAALACVVAAGFSATLIEDSTEITVRRALDAEDLTWAEIEANGLKVILSGTAPTEARRFKALSTAGAHVDAARVIDEIDVVDSRDVAPPRFSVELLRNDNGIQLIGLIPAATDRESLVGGMQSVAENVQVADLLETADYPVPDNWETSLAYAVSVLPDLPRSKISIEAGKVAIKAISESPAHKRRLETDLSRRAPSSLSLALDIAAPRPVITPFTLRFIRNENGTRFDTCSADTADARQKILAAAAKAGLEGKAECIVGLGVPTPAWGDATARAIGAVGEIGQASVTFTDADITLIAHEDTPPAVFDRVVGELENALPDVFALHAVLPEKPAADDDGPPEFVATLSPEGQVQLRGRISGERERQIADSYAKARFGSTGVYTSARIDPDLPADWPVRVLAGLDALSLMSNGVVTVTPETVDVRGNTSDPKARTEISQILSDKLGEAQNYAVNVTYLKRLDPVASKPSPDECEAEIAGILEASKIAFEPGKATIDPSASGIMDDISDVLKSCGEIRMEIGGHTDSQGREEMNQQLSQTRADAVLAELRARRVLTSSFTAVGYGESQPIADNDSPDGRETNRRIEFKLIRPKPTAAETESTLDSLAETNGAEEDDTSAEDSETDEQN